MTKLTIFLGLALVACILQAAESRGFTRGSEGNDEANDDEPGLKRYRRSSATTKAELKARLDAAGSALVVIEFTTTWCSSCKTIKPRWDAMAAQFPGLSFLTVDIDESEDIAFEYEITTVPRFVFIKNGAVLETLVGANIDKLNATIQKHK